MGLKKWQLSEPDFALAKSLADECDISSFTAMLACNRGITDSYELDVFLSSTPELDDPFLLTDMELCVERISAALTLGEKIAIYGDYDCDGVTATALMYSYLKSKNADVLYYIPDRITEGYGLNVDAVNKLYSLGVNLIITVDNGISAIGEIEVASSLGIDVVVTDHHLPGDVLPEAVAVVDPHRADDQSGFTNLCGVGVAFKVICAMESETPVEELLLEYAPLITLGTIGDVVPLLSENRSICKVGIDIINNSAPVGIGALKAVAGVENKPLTASSVSFSLVPRINAAGRMGSSMRAVELLLTTDRVRATELATELDNDNSNRQKICETIFIEATQKIEADNLKHNRVIVVASNNWHLGVIGIVASKIVEKYGKPCILFGGDGELYHGSGRSIEGFNLFDAINSAKECVEYFGGHELAAGVTLKKEQLQDFYGSVLSYAETNEVAYPKINIDCKLRPEIIGKELVDEIKKFEPCGSGNSLPVFALFGVTINSITPLKAGKYVRLNIGRDGYNFNALCFMYSEESFPFSKGSQIDIAFNLEYNEYMGRGQVNLMAKQLRPHGIDEDAYFRSLKDYEALLCDKCLNPLSIYPNREEFTAIFRYLKANAIAPLEKILFKHHALGAGKVATILNAFCQLGLAEEKQNGYILKNIHGKVELESAAIIKQLTKIIKAGEG